MSPTVCSARGTVFLMSALESRLPKKNVRVTTKFEANKTIIRHFSQFLVTTFKPLALKSIIMYTTAALEIKTSSAMLLRVKISPRNSAPVRRELHY